MHFNLLGSQIDHTMTRRVSIPACRPMANVRIDAYEQDFEFAVGDEIDKCPGFFAEFLSPTVSRYRQMDATFTTFTVKLNQIEGVFSQVFSLCRGSEIDIEKQF
jgi:hypothetical protein